MMDSLGARRVKAILWKRLTATDAYALLNVQPASGTGGGAKHIALRFNLDVPGFLGNIERTGGKEDEPEYRIEVADSAGERRPVTIAYDIRGTSRKEWLIRRQNADERHPAWDPGKKLPSGQDDIPSNYLVLVRLTDGSYHARAASADEVQRMPARIREAMIESDQGIIKL